MLLNFDTETREMVNNLRLTEGYLDCEKIVINNLKKHIDAGHDDRSINDYLKNLSVYFESRIDSGQDVSVCTNYRYAAGFLNTLLRMPYWRRWMETIDK